MNRKTLLNMLCPSICLWIIALFALLSIHAHCQSLPDTLALGVSVAGDAIATQRGLAQGFHEADPIARPFVTHGAPGQAAFSSLQFAGTIGIARLLIHFHHPKAARFAIRLMSASEGAAVANNLIRERR